MMKKVLLNNAISRAYKKLHVFGAREITFYLKKIIEASDLPKRGGKRKAKAVVTVSVNVS